MGVLGTAVPVAFVASTDLERSIGFYRDTLGLTLLARDACAAIFQLGAAMLRVVPVGALTAASYMVLSWEVPDVTAVVQRLDERGVALSSWPPHLISASWRSTGPATAGGETGGRRHVTA